MLTAHAQNGAHNFSSYTGGSRGGGNGAKVSHLRAKTCFGPSLKTGTLVLSPAFKRRGPNTFWPANFLIWPRLTNRNQKSNCLFCFYKSRKISVTLLSSLEKVSFGVVNVAMSLSRRAAAIYRIVNAI